MSKQLDALPCIGCKFFSVLPSAKSRCLNEGNMCNDFSCYREQSLTRAELVALLSEGLNFVRGCSFTPHMCPWLTKASEALDRE